MSDIQVPQLTPEQQAAQQVLNKKKQLFMYAVLQASGNGMKSCDGLSEQQFQILLAEFSNTLPIASGMSTIDYMIKNSGYKTIIFSHEFMKAFFGQENWWAYGCAMLKEEQPLFYLEAFFKPVQQKQEWK